MSNWYKELLSDEGASFVFGVLLFFLFVVMAFSFALMGIMAFSYAARIDTQTVCEVQK